MVDGDFHLPRVVNLLFSRRDIRCIDDEANISAVEIVEID